MKKKRTQTVERTTIGGGTVERTTVGGGEKQKKSRQCGGGKKKGQKVEKECSEWTAGGLEHQDGAGRP